MENLATKLGALVLLAGLALLLTLPTMWLWNWLMPIIFGVIKISFWQALGINFLSAILFKNTNSKSDK